MFAKGQLQPSILTNLYPQFQFLPTVAREPVLFYFFCTLHLTTEEIMFVFLLSETLYKRYSIWKCRGEMLCEYVTAAVVNSFIILQIVHLRP